MGEFLSYYCSLDCGSPTRQVWYLIFVMTAPLLLFNCSLFFVFRHGVSLFGGFLHPPVDGCSTASYDSGALCRRRWAHVLLLHHLEPIYSTICWIDYSFPIECLGTLVENQLTINVLVYFWTLNSIPLIFMSIHLLVSHCLKYCRLVVSSDIGKCESSSSLPFWDCIWPFGTVTFPCEF